MEQLLNSEETELCKILSLALHGKKSFDTDRKIDWNALIQMAESIRYCLFYLIFYRGQIFHRNNKRFCRKKDSRLYSKVTGDFS